MLRAVMPQVVMRRAVVTRTAVTRTAVTWGVATWAAVTRAVVTRAVVTLSDPPTNPASLMSEPSEAAESLPPQRPDGEYVVVARRYRPQLFSDLVGQSTVAQALCNAITTDRVGHAYLFTGARGVGKTSTARILAKALNCVDGPTTAPCGNCDLCIQIASGDDVDVLEIDGASNRGIDEIRQLRANMRDVRPSRSDGSRSTSLTKSIC